MKERSEDLKSGKNFLWIDVPADLARRHLFFLFFIHIFGGCLLMLPAVIQPIFLKEIIGIPERFAGTINAGLQIMSQIATLLFVGMIGALSDKYGRKILLWLGFLFSGLFYIVFGYTKVIAVFLGVNPTVALFFTRFLVGLGLVLTWPQFSTLIADYTLRESRGKAMALSGVVMGIAAIITFFLISQIPRRMGIFPTFLVGGVIGLMGALLTRIFLIDKFRKEKVLKKGLRDALKAVSQSLALKVCYVAISVSRPDMMIMGTFIFVWMVTVAHKFGLTPAQATAKGGMVMGIQTIIALVVFPIFGILVDKWGRIPVIILSLLGGGGSLTLIGTLDNPFSPILLLYVAIWGFFSCGAMVGTSTLTADVAPKHLLGIIFGGSNTIQAIGIILFLQVCGLFFDRVGYASPFALKGIASLLVAVWIFLVRKGIKVPDREIPPVPTQGKI